MLYNPCETGYPLELIQQIPDVKGLAGPVDEILREESSTYLERVLRHGLLAYVGPKAFENKRLLDFGCGNGASTMVLSRTLPETKFVAVDLCPEFLKIAEMRANHYGAVDDIRFSCSPDGFSIPSEVGEFDFVCMSGVYEHLLAEERPPIIAQLAMLEARRHPVFKPNAQSMVPNRSADNRRAHVARLHATAVGRTTCLFSARTNIASG